MSGAGGNPLADTGKYCDQCGRIFTRRSFLREHILQVHERLRRFRCEICGASYLQRAHANKHVASSHPQQAAAAGRSLSGLVSKLSDGAAKHARDEGSDGFHARFAGSLSVSASHASPRRTSETHRQVPEAAQQNQGHVDAPRVVHAGSEGLSTSGYCHGSLSGEVGARPTLGNSFRRPISQTFDFARGTTVPDATLTDRLRAPPGESMLTILFACGR